MSSFVQSEMVRKLIHIINKQSEKNGTKKGKKNLMPESDQTNIERSSRDVKSRTTENVKTHRETNQDHLSEDGSCVVGKAKKWKGE